MRNTTKIANSCLLALMCLFFQPSCQRQRLEDPEYLLAAIPIVIDWSQSRVPTSSIANVSAYFYPRSGGAPVTVVSDNIYYVLAKLPIGVYDVLIFNEMKDNASGMVFSNESPFEQFSIGAVEVPDSRLKDLLYNVQRDEYFIDFPDPMASYGDVDPLEVTAYMVNFTRSYEFENYLSRISELSKTPDKLYSAIMASRASRFSELSSASLESNDLLELVYPQPVTTDCTVTLKVVNLSNAQRIECVIKGLTNEVALYDRRRAELSVSDKPIFSFDFDKKHYYDATEVDGSVTGKIETFGRQPKEAGVYEAVFTAVLSSGESMTIKRDVSDQVNANRGKNLSIKIDLSSDEDMMVLPEGRAPGFGVDDWGSSEDVEVH